MLPSSRRKLMEVDQEVMEGFDVLFRIPQCSGLQPV